MESNKLDEATAKVLNNIFGKAEPTIAVKGKTVNESLVRDWVDAQIQTAVNELNIGVDSGSMDKIQDSVWSAALAGKLGDGTPSTETSNAISQMVQQLLGSNATQGLISEPEGDLDVQSMEDFLTQLTLPESTVDPAIGKPEEADVLSINDRLTPSLKGYLQEFAEIVGTEWKSALKTAWETGDYPQCVDSNIMDAMEQIKNMNDQKTSGLKKTYEAIEEEGPTSEQYLVEDVFPLLDEMVEEEFGEPLTHESSGREGELESLELYLDERPYYLSITIFGSYMTENDWMYEVRGKIAEVPGEHTYHARFSGNPQNDAETILQDMKEIIDDLKGFYDKQKKADKNRRLARRESVVKEALSVPDQHRKKIALKTLRLSDAGARILGGMTKDEARSFLRKIGYSDSRINQIEIQENKKENKMNKIETIIKVGVQKYIEEHVDEEIEQVNEAATKKDFELVAKFLRSQADTIKKSDLVDFFVTYYKNDNPRFQEDRFRAAVEGK